MNMETKSAAVEIKTNSTPGEFTAVISAIGNIDRQGDRAMPGSFSKTMSEDPIPPVYWAHQHMIPPIGDGMEWFEQGKEIVYKGSLFVKGDDEHQYAKMVYAGMKSRDGRPPAINQFSYTYGIPEGGSERIMEDGKSIRLLHVVQPVAEVGPCFMGANPQTYLLDPAKSADDVNKLVLARAAAGKRVGMKEILAETLGLDSKDWGDVDGYAIRQLLNMVDNAVSFIQWSEDSERVLKMQSIAGELVALLQGGLEDVTQLVATNNALEAAIEGGKATPNEARAAQALPPVESKEETEPVAGEKEVPAGEVAGEKGAAVEAPPEQVAETEAVTPAAEPETPAEDVVPTADTTSSDDASTVSNDEIARLAHTWPSH